MSSNIINKQDGSLITIGNSARCWIGTKSAHDTAVAQGKMPNNVMVCITDQMVDSEDYSTEEILTNKHWIDGKPIYRKVIDVGVLPNATTKLVAHGILNLDRVIHLYGTYINSPNKWAPIPWTSTGSTGNNISCEVDSADVRIVTGVDRSSDYSCYVILEYTKSS